MKAHHCQQNFNRRNKLRLQAYPILLGTTLTMTISLLSACTIRSDASYSAKVSEIETAPASEAVLGGKVEQPAESETPPTVLVELLKTDLAAELGVPATEISLREATPTQWNDACLGAPRPTEICAQVITPGYRIVLGTSTGTYMFHTDQTGKSFRRLDTPLSL